MRTFQLVRTEDASGVSGTGHVAEGVELSNGRCVLSWHGELSSIAIYDDVITLINIHGHEGRTKVVFDDTGEEVTDMYTPEEILEQFVESGSELSADGWAVALDIDKLLKDGVDWAEIPKALNLPVTEEECRILYLVAAATGSL